MADSDSHSSDKSPARDEDHSFFENVLTLIPRHFCADREIQEPSNAKRARFSESKEATRVAELKVKLQEKLHQLKGKRKTCEEDETIKDRRLADKEKKRKHKKKVTKFDKSSDRSAGTATNKAADNKAAAPKQVFNKDGNIVFSKFDFTQANHKPTKSEGSAGGKNYKQLLLKVQKRKEKEKQLEEVDKAAADTFKEKTQWQNVIQKAEGVKLKDDEALLKKSLKRQEKLKKKMGKAWDDRQDKMDERKKKQQDKRKANIRKKKEGRINKKIKHSKKKGHIIPGF